MSQEHFQNPCKPRFKGIERFLKRVAFNLGNTPSQTEVKIISCIPIDVTDLQQKILILEKELNDARKKIEAKNKNKKESQPPTAVGRALCDSSTIDRGSHCETNTCFRVPSQQILTHCRDCTLEQNKSDVSYAYPSISKPNINVLYERYPSNHSLISKWDRHKLIANERVKNIFRKRKKKKPVQEKTRGKTQLVYYTQTNTNNMNVFSRSYLADVFRKHHDPKLVVNEFSDTSHFSQPICRDVRQDNRHPLPHDLDICSCCHGGFQNLDIYMNDFNVCNTKTNKNIDEKKMNFVTDIGDLIPVKEKLDQAKINEDIKRKPKNNKDIGCWHENISTKRRHHSTVVNYQVAKETVNLPAIKPKHKNKKYNEIKYSGKIQPNYKSIPKSNPYTRVETAKMCYVDCGDAYIKSPTAPIKIPSVADETKKSNLGFQKNDENFKHKSITADCTKTELTLNEIKRILQTVLTEIKNNSETFSLHEKKIKKDAIVQKGPSHNNVQPSTLLPNFTYNTSDYTNPYLFPCPGRIPTAQYCFPNIAYDPIRCMQNQPVNRHAHGGHICTCNHKDNATQISEKPTNTNVLTDNEKRGTNNKETEKLIKEIYRSVAPNMEYPSKESSFSRYDELKSTVNESTVTDTIVLTDTSSDFSKVMKKDAQVEALLSALTSATTASKVVYTATNTQPRYPCKLLKCDSSNTESRKAQRHMTTDCITEAEELSDTTSSIESDDNIAVLDTGNTKDKKKNGIIKNMLNSVNIFKKKKEVNKKEGTSDIGDSDGYETIYSEKANNMPCLQRKRITGINYIKPPAYRTKKRTPHMDQEYRRRWNEDLMFRENRYSPKLANTSHRYKSSRPVYYQDYEARAAVVKPTYLNNKPGLDSNNDTRPKKLSWLKRHELRTGCGKRWKEFLLEN